MCASPHHPGRGAVAARGRLGFVTDLRVRGCSQVPSFGYCGGCAVLGLRRPERISCACRDCSKVLGLLPGFPPGPAESQSRGGRCASLGEPDCAELDPRRRHAVVSRFTRLGLKSPGLSYRTCYVSPTRTGALCASATGKGGCARKTSAKMGSARPYGFPGPL